jgi:putative hemolysin
MVEEAAQAGSLDVRAGEIAARAIEFEKLTAEDVMIPRGRMVAISRDASRDDLRKLLLEQRHSRMPVYERTLDRIVGYIAADDVLTDILEGRDLSIADRVRPVEIVPSVMPVTRILQRLQKEHTRLAIAVDEFGGVAGLITLEDLVEELVGDIRSENERAEVAVQRETGGTILVPGHFPVRLLERVFSIDVPDGDYTTVAGLVIELAGRIPSTGERMSLADGTGFEIVEAVPHAVRKVRITPRPA